MSYFREEIFDILFTEWNTLDTKVKLAHPVVMIIETHFGSDGDIVLPMSELVQLYHLARRDLTDYVELTYALVLIDLPFYITYGFTVKAAGLKFMIIIYSSSASAFGVSLTVISVGAAAVLETIVMYFHGSVGDAVSVITQ